MATANMIVTIYFNDEDYGTKEILCENIASLDRLSNVIAFMLDDQPVFLVHQDAIAYMEISYEDEEDTFNVDLEGFNSGKTH